MSGDYRILVAIDLKPDTDRLLAEARRYANAFDATVDLIHVAAPDPAFVGYIKGKAPGGGALDSERDHRAKELRSEHRQIQACAETLRAGGVRVDQSLMVQGMILETILEEARKLGSDLLILGSHHHGALYRLLYGDFATQVVHRPPCAVLVLPM